MKEAISGFIWAVLEFLAKDTAASLDTSEKLAEDELNELWGLFETLVEIKYGREDAPPIMRLVWERCYAPRS